MVYEALRYYQILPQNSNNKTFSVCNAFSLSVASDRSHEFLSDPSVEKSATIFPFVIEDNGRHLVALA